jgi:hypothetical protein
MKVIVGFIVAFVLGLGATLAGAIPAHAGSNFGTVGNIAGAPVRVDYNLGHGPYQWLFEKKGPRNPWHSKIGKDVDRFRSNHKRCVRVTNPIRAKQRGVWYTKPGKWYEISGGTYVEVYAWNAKDSKYACGTTHELPKK